MLCFFFKGGDPVEFRKANDAYSRLIAHIARLDALEAEAELSQTSVIIEVSKQSAPLWADKLTITHGRPKTCNVRNTIFEVE